MPHEGPLLEEIPLEEIADKTLDFEEQFAHKEQINVAGGTAEVIDISPEHPTDEVPVFLAPAWACTSETYKPAIKELVDLGRRVVSVNHPRFGGERDLQDIPDDIADKYPYEEIRKARNILDVLEEKNIAKTDVIAHSESAVNVTIAAAIRPDLFREVVYYAPAGLIGKDTFFRLLNGFSKQNDHKSTLDTLEVPAEIRERVERDGGQIGTYNALETGGPGENTATREALQYILKNPVRSLAEGEATAESQIHTMLRYLHEKGIGIAIMAGVDDPVFPIDKMQKIIKDDMIDGFLSVRGGHGEIGGVSGNHIHMQVAGQMLTKLKEKRDKEEKIWNKT